MSSELPHQRALEGHVYCPDCGHPYKFKIAASPVRAPKDDPEGAFSKWLNEGPKLALAAGCHVGIKVTAAPTEGQANE